MPIHGGEWRPLAIDFNINKHSIACDSIAGTLYVDELCAQMTRYLFAIAKFLLILFVLNGFMKNRFITKSSLCNCSRDIRHNILKQELSYRKLIARQLRTQFFEGISVTLKSTLRATQGHWKRNHWTYHTATYY